ncbi:MAG: ABC transporter permease [Anaerolineae bacterium]
MRLWNVIYKEAIELVRYWPLLLVILLAPVIEMVSMAYALSAGVQHLPTAVLDRDHSQAARQVVAAARNSGRFAPDLYASDGAEVNHLLDSGLAQAALVIPRGFEKDLRAGQTAQLQLLLDGSNAATADIARSYGQAIVGHYALEAVSQGGSGRWPPAPVSARSRVWFNEDLRSENFFVPGEIGAVLAFLILILTAISIVREKERGTLEQLMVTPLRSIEIIIGKAVPAVGLTFIGLLAMVAAALYWFQVPLRGSLALLLGLSGLYIIVEMGWGLLISSVARTQGQALMAAFFLDSLDVVLSGYLMPLENMPRAAQWASSLVPLRYYIVITRNIFLKGSGLPELWSPVLALCLLGAGLFALAAWRLRRGIQ